jgi:hypothetical protein
MKCPDESLPLKDFERQGLVRGNWFVKYVTAYSAEH